MNNMKNQCSIQDLRDAGALAWNRRNSPTPEPSATTHYRFQLNQSGHWYDPVYHRFLFPLLAHCGVDIIPDYVDYCLITTDIAELKYRKTGNVINLYVTKL